MPTALTSRRPTRDVPTASSTSRAHRPARWHLPAGSPGALVTLAFVAIAGMIASALVLDLGTKVFGLPLANTLYAAYLAAAPVLIGLAWRVRRPDSAIGPLLMLFGVFAWIHSFQGSTQPILYATGVIVGQTMILAWTFYMALAFPIGRLRGRADRVAMALVGLAIIVFVAWTTQVSHLDEGLLAKCFVLCPPNSAAVDGMGWLTDISGRFATLAGLASAVGVLLIIGWRIVRDPRRGAFVSVGLTALLFAAALVAFMFSRIVIRAGTGVPPELNALVLGAAAAIPLGFLAALLRDELAGRTAGRRLLYRLVSTDLAGWRDALAEAVGDPGLRLGFWDAAASGYREPSGAALTAMDVAPERAWVPVQRDEQPLAAIVADRSVTGQSQVMSAVTEATILAAEMRRSESDLRHAREEAAAAESAARERMARDLHDSAQQRLIALRIHLGLARERLPESNRSTIDDLGQEVDAALREIRSIARGTDVSGLEDGGLSVALARAAERSGIGVSVDLDGVTRYPPPVERAVYYTVLEALQNAAKHGGAATLARVVVRGRGAHLAFAIVDDGPGLRAGAEGSGRDGMRARVHDVGGRLRVRSADGRGTCVIGRVPRR
ncbi:MAG TPA: histidine kinase [Candidatus Limnocylindria bacterium]|nr:histidine kinase [Candidatus Limnocylindria bacterium]